jgi:hypothetical protein
MLPSSCQHRGGCAKCVAERAFLPVSAGAGVGGACGRSGVAQWRREGDAQTTEFNRRGRIAESSSWRQTRIYHSPPEHRVAETLCYTTSSANMTLPPSLFTSATGSTAHHRRRPASRASFHRTRLPVTKIPPAV